jgi:hypothetical protein
VGAELEVVVSAVTTLVTGGVLTPLTAPAAALTDYWKDRVRSRLESVGSSVSKKRDEVSPVVNDRVSYHVLTEAAFTDDPVVHNYLAGVIAGSSSEGDDGIPVLAEIARLSAFQIRLHYILYRAWRGRGDSRMYLAKDGLESAFEAPFDPLIPRFEDAGRWLGREDLVATGGRLDRWGKDDGFRVVSTDSRIVDHVDLEIPQTVYHPTQPGIVYSPTLHGYELFCWACGRPDMSNSAELLPEGAIEVVPEVPGCSALAVHELPEVPFEEWFRESLGR